MLGVDDTSYETYEDVRNLDKKFKKIALSILKLKPKDVKKFGISKQTLWNAKQKIKLNQLDGVSYKIKLQILHVVIYRQQTDGLKGISNSVQDNMRHEWI